MNLLSSEKRSESNSAGMPTQLAIRALELAMKGSAGEATDLASVVRAFGATVSLAELGDALRTVDGWGVDVGQCEPKSLLDALDQNLGVIFPTAKGWIVVPPQHGGRRGVRLTVAGERSVRIDRSFIAKHLDQPLVDAAFLQSESGLERLRQPGATRFVWRRLWALGRLERRDLWALVAYGVVLGALSLAVPLAVQVLVNSIAFTSFVQPIVVLSLLLGGVLVLTAMITILQSYGAELLARRIFVRIAESFGRRLSNPQLHAQSGVDPSDLSTRFFEVVTLQKSLSKLLIDGLGLVLQIFVGMALLGFYHPFLLAFDIVMVVALGLVLVLGHGAVSSALRESSSKYRVASWMRTVACEHRRFASGSGSRYAENHTDALVRDYLRSRRSHYVKLLRQSIGGVTTQVFAMVGLLGLGGWLVIRGELALGQLVAAELVVGSVGAGLAKSGRYFEAAYDLLASLEKVGMVIDPPRRLRANTRREIQGGIELRTKSLRVDQPGRTTLQLPDLRIPAGSSVAIEAGPTTSRLAQVLAGQLSPSAGQVIACTGKHAPFSPAQLGEEIRIARPLVPSGLSIRDFMALAREGVGETEILAAMQVVGLSDLAGDLDAGLETMLETDGAPLSTPEVARLALAQAIVAQPRVIVLDGVVDVLGMDANGVHSLVERVQAQLGSCTMLVISSHPVIRSRFTDLEEYRHAQ